MYLIKTTKGMT